MTRAGDNVTDHHKLTEAALRNLHLDCMDAEDGFVRFQTRLLAMNDRGLVIGVPSNQGQPIELAIGQKITCTCRLGREILRFQTEPVGRTQHEVNPRLQVDAVILAEPERLETVQRRRYYRVSLVGRNPLDVTLWPVEVGLDGEAKVVAEYHGKIADISAGGIGVLLKEPQFIEQARGRQVWARFALPGENESLIFLMKIRRAEQVETSGLWTIGLEIKEFIEPGDHEVVIDQLARFVVAQEREQLNRRKDR